MIYKKEVDQNASLQLAKDSETELVKTYFSRVFELRQTGKEFPINLDDVWPIVYQRKDIAVRVLKSDFVENEDYIIQKIENQQIRKNAEQKTGAKKVDAYFLSVPCLEFFIAKKVKPVFEVYRQVFHKAVEGKAESARLSQNASELQEETVITVPMGKLTNQIYVTGGVIYAKFSPIMRYLGYQSGPGSQYVDRIGRHNFKVVTVGTQESWFMNINGFDILMRLTTLPIPSAVMSSIYRDVYGIEKPEAESPFTFRFTDSEMLAIMAELNRKPINRTGVTDLLFNGKK